MTETSIRMKKKVTVVTKVIQITFNEVDIFELRGDEFGCKVKSIVEPVNSLDGKIIQGIVSQMEFSLKNLSYCVTSDNAYIIKNDIDKVALFIESEFCKRWDNYPYID